MTQFTFISEFMKTVSQRIHALTWREDIKSKKNQSVFLHSFIFLSLLSFPYFFLFCMAWRLRLGVKKSKWNMGNLTQIIDTAFMTDPAIP